MGSSQGTRHFQLQAHGVGLPLVVGKKDHQYDQYFQLQSILALTGRDMCDLIHLAHHTVDLQTSQKPSILLMVPTIPRQCNAGQNCLNLCHRKLLRLDQCMHGPMFLLKIQDTLFFRLPMHMGRNSRCIVVECPPLKKRPGIPLEEAPLPVWA